MPPNTVLLGRLVPVTRHVRRHVAIAIHILHAPHGGCKILMPTPATFAGGASAAPVAVFCGLVASLADPAQLSLSLDALAVWFARAPRTAKDPACVEAVLLLLPALLDTLLAAGHAPRTFAVARDVYAKAQRYVGEAGAAANTALLATLAAAPPSRPVLVALELTPRNVSFLDHHLVAPLLAALADPALAPACSKAIVSVLAPHDPLRYLPELAACLLNPACTAAAATYLLPKLPAAALPPLLPRVASSPLAYLAVVRHVPTAIASVPSLWAQHGDPAIRVALFQTLTHSVQALRAPSAAEYAAAEAILPLFGDTLGKNHRDQLFLLMRLFLARARDASIKWKHEPQVAAAASAFCHTLARHCETSLAPSRLHLTVDAAVRLLQIAARCGVDATVPTSCLFKPGTHFPLSTDLFTPETVRRLVDLLAYEFAPLRTLAGEVLSLVVPAPDVPISAVVPLLASPRGRDADLGAAVLRAIKHPDPAFLRTVVTNWELALAQPLPECVSTHPLHGWIAGITALVESQGVEFVRDMVPTTTALLEASYARCALLLGDASPTTSALALSYAFRTAKEAAALSEALLPVASLADTVSTLSSQLVTLRHPGVFPALQAALTSTLVFAPELVEPALAQVLTAVSSPTLLTSRRSGGVPYLIVAVLRATPDISPALEALGRVCTQPHDHGLLVDLPPVHALNCLRAVYTDGPLAKKAKAYVPQALQISLGHSAGPWELRNAAVQLFTVLEKRMFVGGRVDATVFFHTHPVEAMVEQILLQGPPEAVYPALALLSRLSGTSQHLGSLVEPWLECKVWKLREAAARVYAGEAGSAVMAEFMRTGTLHQNRLHGRLLVCVELARAGVPVPVDASAWLRYVTENPCPTTAKAFLDVVSAAGQTAVQNVDSVALALLAARAHDMSPWRLAAEAAQEMLGTEAPVQAYSLADALPESPLPQRIAALESVTTVTSEWLPAVLVVLLDPASLRLAACRACAHGSAVPFRLHQFSFLSDDDEEVRDAAAADLSLRLELPHVMAPVVVADAFVSWWRQHGTAEPLGAAVASHAAEFRERAEMAVNPSNELFALERENFYRDPVEHLKRLVAMGQPDQEVALECAHVAATTVAALGEDLPLSWSRHWEGYSVAAEGRVWRQAAHV